MDRNYSYAAVSSVATPYIVVNYRKRHTEANGVFGSPIVLSSSVWLLMSLPTLQSTLLPLWDSRPSVVRPWFIAPVVISGVRQWRLVPPTVHVFSETDLP